MISTYPPTVNFDATGIIVSIVADDLVDWLNRMVEATYQNDVVAVQELINRFYFEVAE